jgi:hypothetical protein
MKVHVLHLDAADRTTLEAALADDGHAIVSDEQRERGLVPDVVVVCLDAQPQRTLELAARVANAASVPVPSILFVGGTPAALQEAQRRFPRASFARLDALSTALASMDG